MILYLVFFAYVTLFCEGSKRIECSERIECLGSPIYNDHSMMQDDVSPDLANFMDLTETDETDDNEDKGSSVL